MAKCILIHSSMDSPVNMGLENTKSPEKTKQEMSHAFNIWVKMSFFVLVLSDFIFSSEISQMRL